MNRIPPSQEIGKKTEELLRQGLDGEADVTSLVIRLGIERVVQELVEQEVTDYLEQEHDQRRRTRTIPRFFSEKSCLKLVFATLWRASQQRSTRRGDW